MLEDKLEAAGRAYLAIRIHTLALYVLGLAATAFSLAGYFALITVTTPPIAALCVGGGLLLLAVLILYLARPKRQAASPPTMVENADSGDSSEPQASSGGSLGVIEKVVKDNPSYALMGAALLGGAMVVSPKTRRLVLTAATLLGAKSRLDQ